MRLPSRFQHAGRWAQRSLSVALLVLAPAVLAAPKFEDSIAQRTLACTACHGDQGRAGPDGYYPRLAGKPAGYLYNQLLNFRDGRRHYGLMARLVDPLSDAYLYEIAQHFASLNVPYPAPSSAAPRPAEPVLARGRDLALHGDAALRLPACVQCHGQALTGACPPCRACWACRWTTSWRSWAVGEPASAAPTRPTAWATSCAAFPTRTPTRWSAGWPPSPCRPTRGLPPSAPQPRPIRPT